MDNHFCGLMEEERSALSFQLGERLMLEHRPRSRITRSSQKNSQFFLSLSLSNTSIEERDGA